MATFSIDDIPAMQPPLGVQPNFDNPETLHPVVVGVAIATMIAMVIVVGIRIFTKAYLMREMKVEEYFAIIATAGIIMWDSIFIHVSYGGFSRHLWDVRLVNVEHLAYVNYLAEISQALTMFAAKCSILFQLKRLFCPGQSRNAVFWALHVLLFLNAAYYLSAVFTFMFQCIPREKTWNRLLEGQCIDVAAATVVSGAVNLFLDLGILVVPIWAIFHLQLPMKRKLGISAVFGVGIVTCAIAAVGVVLRVPLLSDPDLTWIITKVGIWTMVEYFGTILVGCMPSFPRFFLYLRGRDPSTAASASKECSGHSGSMPPSRQTNAPSLYHSAVMQSNNKSVRSIGMAVTTSEESFAEPTYIELEDGTYQHDEGLYVQFSAAGGRSGLKEDGMGRKVVDWSPLSSRASL
ncbi:hypothetical protein B0H66DRAFT_587829 [Apodospora peruviana]|uniref:Rhodopsin domain-containing protein n=1 Tax=Apodospora peruviana TaxID=516989 RepID=A0AAE0IGZ1_9PEZI|nr:hypothetical protein B0H66DRAFT_587829 [Apodospora peruviana]